MSEGRAASGPSRVPSGLESEPDERGRFGEFGGRYVAEGLIAALDELLEATRTIVPSEAFRSELDAPQRVAAILEGIEQ